MIKWLLNKIIETLYPNHIFYGKDANPFTIFEESMGDSNAAFYGAIFIANYVNDGGVTCGEFQLKGLQSSGVNNGDWTIVVKKEATDEN